MKKTQLAKTSLIIVCCLTLSGCGAAPAPVTQNAAQTDTAQTDTPQTDTPQTDTTQTDTPQTDTTQTDMPQTDMPQTDMASSAEAAAAEDAPVESPEIDYGEIYFVTGMITDATKYSVAIQTPEGDRHFLTIPESGVTGNLSYLIIGQTATLGYMGTLDEDHATLTDISASTIESEVYVEEYAFAIKIINAVRSMDLEALSDLSNFPVFIDTGNYYGSINTPGEFEAISTEKIFTEQLVERIVNYNLFDLNYTDAGFVMGSGGPNITFDVDDDGILGIIGINSTATPRSSS